MKHIFETTIRGLIKHYSSYNKENTPIEDENGTISIEGSDGGSYLNIVSNTDSFVLSIFTSGSHVHDAVVYFCDGSISVQVAGDDELHPYSIGGYWTVRDILSNLGNIFKMLEVDSYVFLALSELADNVEKDVLSVLTGICNQFSERGLMNKPGPVVTLIAATPKCPNHRNHQLKIIGGYGKGVYTLDFDIGVYMVDEEITINCPIASADVVLDITGNIYQDIRQSLITLMEGAIITDIDPSVENNFVDASPLDVVKMLAPVSESKEVLIAEDTSGEYQSDYDIIADFGNRVLEKNTYDISMYLKHQHAHEAVLFTKSNTGRHDDVTELPLFRLSIIDGIVIAHFTFHDPACVVSVYMLPGYQNQMLDKVTIIIQDDIMYKRGVSTIHGINRDFTGIMNGALVALGHAVAPQYGRFTSLMETIHPVLTSIVPDLELNNKVIYPVT